MEITRPNQVWVMDITYIAKARQYVENMDAAFMDLEAVTPAAQAFSRATSPTRAMR
jgi:hypothetical protein